MPIIKSAKKRVRVTKKASARNAHTKRTIKTTIKSFTTKQSDVNLRKAQSALDIAVKKGILSKNKAARKKRQLVVAAKAAGVKVTKTAAKKPATPTKAKAKPATKKTAPKKSTIKKAPVKK